MQLVAGAPGAGDIEHDVGRAGVYERVVDVLLEGHARTAQTATTRMQPSPTSSPRFSLSSAPTHKPHRPNIYDRNLNKTRTAEISASAFAFLFSEMVQYTQKRVSGINDLERRSAALLSLPSPIDHPQAKHPRLPRGSTRPRAHGLAGRVLLKDPKTRNTLPPRSHVRPHPGMACRLWQTRRRDRKERREPGRMQVSPLVFPSPLTPPTDMIIDNDPLLERHISVPRDFSTLSCSSFAAGIVEAVLDGLGFVSLVVFPLAPFSSLAARQSHRPQHSHPTISVPHHHTDQAGAVCFRARTSTQVTVSCYRTCSIDPSDLILSVEARET